MKTEDKNLLLQDLCGRLPYGVKCAYFNTKDEIKVGELLTVWCKEKRVFIDKLSIDYDGGDCIGVIPFLFPLSSMTDEQYKEMQEFVGDYAKVLRKTMGKDYALELWLDSVECDATIYLDNIFELQDWLNKNHFDYRGLIPMGLAKDATGLNIY